MIEFAIEDVKYFREMLENISWARPRGGVAYVYMKQFPNGIIFAMSDLDAKYATFYVEHKVENIYVDKLPSSYIHYSALLSALDAGRTKFAFEDKTLPAELLIFEDERNTLIRDCKIKIAPKELESIIKDMRNPVFYNDERPFSKYLCVSQADKELVYTNGQVLVTHNCELTCLMESRAQIYIHLEALEFFKPFIYGDEPFEFGINCSIAATVGNNPTITHYITMITCEDILIAYRSAFTQYPSYDNIFKEAEIAPYHLSVSPNQIMQMISMLPLDPEVDTKRTYWKTIHAIAFNLSNNRMYAESDLADVTAKYFDITPLVHKFHANVPAGEKISVTKEYLEFLFKDADGELITWYMNKHNMATIGHTPTGRFALMPLDLNKHYAMKPKEN
ncbi:MAG: hypothetical protein PHX51_08335 [Clostridia bacterium]|nr:hypothetical protein [Clostridia bacterium]